LEAAYAGEVTRPDWWTPVERAGLKVVGPDEAEPGLLTIRFMLVPDPKSNKWVEYFLHPQPDPWQAFRRPAKESSGMGGLGFVGAVEDERLEGYVATIDKCVADANARFEREDIPAMVADKRRATEASQAAKLRMDRAQERLDRL
jgi:hypothetical protein